MSHSPGVVRSAALVLIVDSSRIGSLSLAGALRREFQVVYAGANGPEALAELLRHPVDVALLSNTLDRVEGKGYELASQFKALSPRTQVVMLVEKSDRDSVVRAFRAGARGIFGRDNHTLSALTKCVERVHQGQVWASSEELLHLLQALSTTTQVRLLNATGAEILAPREQEVVHWVAEGLTNREIAEQLGLSENTVKNYLFRIFDKLGISKRIELALYATSRSVSLAQSPVADPAAALSDDTVLFRWCDAAASRISFLPFALAEFLRDGQGIAADPATALMWLLIGEQLASDLPVRIHEARVDLQQQLTNGEVVAASAKAREWLRKRPSTSVTRVEGELRKAI